MYLHPPEGDVERWVVLVQGLSGLLYLYSKRCMGCLMMLNIHGWLVVLPININLTDVDNNGDETGEDEIGIGGRLLYK